MRRVGKGPATVNKENGIKKMEFFYFLPIPGVKSWPEVNTSY